MSVTTPTAADRARERIRRLGEQQPDALRLARYASLAVRVDASLLRALRQKLLPGSDAGIEADLWFSTLTESVSSQGFVLDGDVVAQLREELAAERVEGEQRALTEAARITTEAHRHWPESLRLEERATALALRTPEAGAAIPPGEDLESLLRGLVKAMTESPSRGMEVARWAQRALVRLPKAARETEAALLLALGAAERLGTPIRFAGDDRPGGLPEAASWVLPTGTFSRWVTIGVRRFDDGLEFIEPDAESPAFRLPDTSPLFVEISWRVGREHSQQTVSVSRGRTVEIPREARDIRFRSLAGEEFALESVESEAADVASDVPPGERPQHDSSPGLLKLASVTVDPHASPLTRITSCGFFVTPDTVLTVGNGGSLPIGLTCTVRWRDRAFTGWVTAEQAPFGPVLVRLQEPVPDAFLLPRRIHGVTSVNVPWRSLAEMSGEIIKLDAEWHRPDGEVVDRLFELSSNALGTRIDWPGAPVVVAGDVVAMIVSATPERILALPWEAIEAFIVQNLRADDASASDQRLSRSIATVAVNAPGTRPSFATGFFVSPVAVVSFWESLPPHVGSECGLRWRDQALVAEVMAEQDGTVLLRLQHAIEGAAVLARRFDPSTALAKVAWATADHNHPEITGTIFRADAEWHGPDGVLERVLELRSRIGAQSLWCGAPVVVDGTVAAQIVSVQGHRIFARPITALEPFLAENLRPAEHDPVVFVSYAYRDEYGKGAEIDEGQIDRVMKALRAARVNPWLDSSFKESDELIKAVNTSEGGAIMLTPVSHLDTGPARIELLALAFRRWAQPDFPVAEFRFRRASLPHETPAPLLVPGVDLDDDSDAHLVDYARRTFGRIGRVPDDHAAVAATRERLLTLMKQARPDSPVDEAADAVIARGVDSPWGEWLSGLDIDDARELADIAATFTFPAEISARVRLLVATGERQAPAFSLNAMPLQVVNAIIRRAWLGRTPPPSIVFRDQTPPDPQSVHRDVCEEISKALTCSADEAALLVSRVDATFLVIFMLRPMPSPSFLEAIYRSMPSAVFFFLLGSEGENPYPKLVVDLKLPAGADMKFFQQYKQVMGQLPRESDPATAETPPPPRAAKRKAARPKPTKAEADAKHVFISSSVESGAAVARLARALEAAALPVWRADVELGTGALLRQELLKAIRASRVVVLVWSQRAARSRWISIEILTAFHLDRFILPCVTDDAALPAFLRHVMYLDLRKAGDEELSRAIRAAADAPAHRNEVAPPVAPRAELRQAVEALASLQQEVVKRLTAGEPAKAAEAQRRVDSEMAGAERRWPSELQVLTLAAYHRKNAYMLKHWDAIQAGQPPNDPLLAEAERLFLQAAFVDPQDVSVLNGLASMLIFERELDAAAFFNERVLELSKQANVPYAAAEQDRQLIASLRRRGGREPVKPRSAR